MEFRIDNLKEEEAEYIGEKINGIVPKEIDADSEEFVLKVENENGQVIGGCIAEAYEYHWARVLLEELWVDERYRHQGIGSMIIREVEKHGYTVFTTLKEANGYISYSLVKYLDKNTPEYVPMKNSGTRFKVSFGNEEDAEVIQNGLDAYDEAYEPKYENVGFYKKLVDKDGRLIAGIISDVDKGDSGYIKALFVEEPLRLQSLGSYLLKRAEEFAKENGASMILTSAGDWNVGFFKKNGYLLRGELKDVPKGHDCYELYKNV